MKIRRGGVLTREYERRVLDGDVMAMRALVHQGMGVQTVDYATREFELAAKPDGTGGTRLTFTGYASVVEKPFTMMDMLGEFTLVLREGAFTKTLSESPDVIFCLNHDWDSVPMARTRAGTLRLSADSTGLFNEADIDPARSDVYKVQSAMEAGELDAQSFAFYVTQQVWSPDFDQRDILEVDIDGGDTSVVTFPANPWTTGTIGLHKRQAHSLMRTGVPALIAQRARGEHADGGLTPETALVLQSVLGLVADADEAVDAAQPLLAALLGVPNPDADEAQSAPDPALVRERQRLAEAERHRSHS